VFVDLRLPSLIAGPINPCKYFPVACIISQIIFKSRFFSQYACLCELCRFSLRGSHIVQRDCVIQQLQEDLNSLQQWESTWLLKFSIPKCYVLQVTRATKYKILSSYYLHNTILEVIENCKYLGVTVQSVLRWSKHIQNITTKGSCNLSFFRRNHKLKKPTYSYLFLLSPSTARIHKYRLGTMAKMRHR